MRLAERLTAKRWTSEVVSECVGDFDSAWVAHAADERTREGAASGGAVTALVAHALESGAVDGALVCVTSVEEGRVRARYRIATCVDDLRAAQGSTYVLGDFSSEAVPLIDEFAGRLAVVALPCEIEFVSRRPELDVKVALRLSLFCGHATRPELVDGLVERMEAQIGAPLVEFRFRTGHWRGMMRAAFADGTVLERPFAWYGLYQNLFLFCARKCLACSDHFGFAADVCAGDLWTAQYKDDPIKHTALVAKTIAGRDWIEIAAAADRLEASEVGVEVVLDGQRRTAPFHANVTARQRAGKRRGITLPDRGQRVRWHEYLAARLVLAGYERTESPDSITWVLGRSRRLWKARLWLLKGLESLS